MEKFKNKKDNELVVRDDTHPSLTYAQASYSNDNKWKKQQCSTFRSNKQNKEKLNLRTIQRSSFNRQKIPETQSSKAMFGNIYKQISHSKIDKNWRPRILTKNNSSQSIERSLIFKNYSHANVKKPKKKYQNNQIVPTNLEQIYPKYFKQSNNKQRQSQIKVNAVIYDLLDVFPSPDPNNVFSKPKLKPLQNYIQSIERRMKESTNIEQTASLSVSLLCALSQLSQYDTVISKYCNGLFSSQKFRLNSLQNYQQMLKSISNKKTEDAQYSLSNNK